MLDFVTNPARELRDYQAQAIDDLRDALREGHRRVVLQAPTGYGKTVLASHVVKMARDKGKRVVFTVPALDLIDQTLASFWADGVGDIGVIQADHSETDWSRPVQIASVQTLARRTFPKADLVIVDECHRAHEVIPKWMGETEVPFIGLSATPWTKGLGKHWDRLLISATTAKLIDLGHLSPFRVFAPSHPDLTGVKTVAGDYHEGQLSEAMNKSPLVADVVETWILRGENRPTLCFGVDRAHAKHLQQRFEQAGIACGYQDAHTQKDERAAIKRSFHSGEFKVVSNVGTLTTGVDWDVRCIILARPASVAM
jgi:DNA repair protein RadD